MSTIQDISQVTEYYILNDTIIEVYKNGEESVILRGDNPKRLEEILMALQQRLKNYQKEKE